MTGTARRRLVTLVGFVAAIAALVALVSVVGVSGTLAEITTVRPLVLLALLACTLGWLAAWSYTLHRVLSSLGTGRAWSYRRSLLLYAATTAVNNVAPFSVAGAEPVSAFLVSRHTRSSYERGFAVIASVDLLNFVPAPAFAVLGSLYLFGGAATGGALPVGIVSLLAALAILSAVAILAWRYRYRVVTALLAVVDTVRRRARRDRPARASTSERVDVLLDTFERVAADRRAIGLGLAASTLGWALSSATLWFALYAVGYEVPVAVALLVVPLAMVADLVPTPGGIGSVDAALVLLVVTTAAVPATAATAAVFFHRASTYLLPTLLGGLALLALRLTE
ncbi:MAG: YbhN family protein [Halarchaeum sp.]